MSPVGLAEGPHASRAFDDQPPLLIKHSFFCTFICIDSAWASTSPRTPYHDPLLFQDEESKDANGMGTEPRVQPHEAVLELRSEAVQALPWGKIADDE